MAYFPFMIDMEGKNCLVVGGGIVAIRKVEQVLSFGAKVKVVSPKGCLRLKKLNDEKQIQWTKKSFEDVDVEQCDFVIAATNDLEVNFHISDLCKKKGILVNVVDVKEACSFLFPAIVRKQDMVIAISSGGKSPAAVSYIKEKIGETIPEYYGKMIEELGIYRDAILKKVKDEKKRKYVFHELVEYADSHEGQIPEHIVIEIIEKYSNQEESFMD